ncbi:hypothetical protein FNF27_04663 [Cafeteria roenbergensis]|uniref:AB hydrolase-1 domain-containing protein n=1 Tax=Cafeteria roenbergensis TaxID=33653 RepID=A0A5A8E840_CAFRO|nr:hypothetical protein FNF27_04663 [Cafeteria roenbergensis]
MVTISVVVYVVAQPWRRIELEANPAKYAFALSTIDVMSLAVFTLMATGLLAATKTAARSVAAAGAIGVLALAVTKELISPLPLPKVVVWTLVGACIVVAVRVWDLWLPVSQSVADAAEGRLLRAVLSEDEFSIVRMRVAPHGQRVIIIQDRLRPEGTPPGGDLPPSAKLAAPIADLHGTNSALGTGGGLLSDGSEARHQTPRESGSAAGGGRDHDDDGWGPEPGPAASVALRPVEASVLDGRPADSARTAQQLTAEQLSGLPEAEAVTNVAIGETYGRIVVRATVGGRLVEFTRVTEEDSLTADGELAGDVDHEWDWLGVREVAETGDEDGGSSAGARSRDGEGEGAGEGEGEDADAQAAHPGGADPAASKRPRRSSMPPLARHTHSQSHSHRRHGTGSSFTDRDSAATAAGTAGRDLASSRTFRRVGSTVRRVPAAPRIARDSRRPRQALGPISEVAGAAVRTTLEAAMPFHAAGDAGISAQSTPQWLAGVTAVMTHAFGAASALWVWTLPAIVRSMKRVVLIDWRECGLSDRTGVMPSTRTARHTESYFADGLRATLLQVDFLLGSGDAFTRRPTDALRCLLADTPGPADVVDVTMGAEPLQRELERLTSLRPSGRRSGDPSAPLLGCGSGSGGGGAAACTAAGAGSGGGGVGGARAQRQSGLTLRSWPSDASGCRGLGRHILVGHSMGGYMSSAYALRAEDHEAAAEARQLSLSGAAGKYDAAGAAADDDGAEARRCPEGVGCGWADCGGCGGCGPGDDGAGTAGGATVPPAAAASGPQAAQDALTLASLERWVLDSAGESGSAVDGQGSVADSRQSGRGARLRAQTRRGAAAAAADAAGAVDDEGAASARAAAGAAPEAGAPGRGLPRRLPASEAVAVPIGQEPGARLPNPGSSDADGSGAAPVDAPLLRDVPADMSQSAETASQTQQEADEEHASHALLTPPDAERRFARVGIAALSPEQLVLLSPLGMPLAVPAAHQRTAPTQTMLWTVLSSLWSFGATPQAAARLLGPFAIVLIRGVILSSHRNWTKLPGWRHKGNIPAVDKSALVSYMFNVAGQPAADEIALSAVVHPGAWPKDSVGKRLIWRLPASVPVSFFYGASHDWMGSLYGTRVCEALTAKWEDEGARPTRGLSAGASLSLDRALALLQLHLAAIELSASSRSSAAGAGSAGARGAARLQLDPDSSDNDSEPDPAAVPAHGAALGPAPTVLSSRLSAQRADDEDPRHLVLPSPWASLASLPALPRRASRAARVARFALSFSHCRASNDVISSAGHLLQIENPVEFANKFLQTTAAGARASFVRAAGRWWLRCMDSGHASPAAAFAWDRVVERRGNVPVSSLRCMLRAAFSMEVTKPDAGADPEVET